MNEQKTTKEIIALYEKYGEADYDGEPVSQTSHMIQSAMQAMAQGEDIELILGAFLHDIGHLLKHEMPTQPMDEYGVVNHEGIGADFLRENGFSDRICTVVEQHVAAKRYLVTTQPEYEQQLSKASYETLMKWQGGYMSKEELEALEQHPFFNDIIKVRYWDEAAKNSNAVLLPLHYFENLLNEYLISRTTK